MKPIKLIVLIGALVLAPFASQLAPVSAQKAQNKPYVDDKLFHFGFQLGLNFASFGVTDSEIPIANPITGKTEIYHARVSSLLPGFHVGFISDLRLCKYLDLHFCIIPEFIFHIVLNVTYDLFFT